MRNVSSYSPLLKALFARCTAEKWARLEERLTCKDTSSGRVPAPCQLGELLWEDGPTLKRPLVPVGIVGVTAQRRMSLLSTAHVISASGRIGSRRRRLTATRSRCGKSTRVSNCFIFWLVFCLLLLRGLGRVKIWQEAPAPIRCVGGRSGRDLGGASALVFW